jgi:SAM-dependent methyltransferase
MPVFGSDYAAAYDALYKDKNYEKECDFLETIFKKKSIKPKTILDLGCGTGGHAAILAKRGYKVTGIDRSEEMLTIARKKTKKSKGATEFIHGDITSLDLNRQFDVVISMFAVMSYQTSNQALAGVCATARKHLSSKGLFIFDCWHGPAVLTDKPGIRLKEVTSKTEGKILRFTEPVVNIMDHTVETRFKLWKVRNEHVVKETNESHLMRFIFPQEIKYFLEVAGFKSIDLSPFMELGVSLTEHHWNMTVIADTGGR